MELRMEDRTTSENSESLAAVSSQSSVASGTSIPRNTMHAEFHKVRQKKSFHTDQELKGFRLNVAQMLERNSFVNAMAFLILADFICTLVDVDAKAAGRELPLWTLATFIRFFGAVLPNEAKFLADLKVMRVVRILRVARVLKKSRSLRELQKLMKMMTTCFAFMTLWAMLLVEFVHPLMEQMFRDGRAFQDCRECTEQASSVMRANLLLFKTVIAGDSWGRIAVPVIEWYPATAIIFCGSLLTVVFGVLNMVVAVVVDSFAESRQKDLLHLAEELEHENEQDKKHLETWKTILSSWVKGGNLSLVNGWSPEVPEMVSEEGMFNRLDSKANGDLTLEQLVDGAKTDPDFQSRLRVMDIDEADLEQLFHMMPGSNCDRLD
eukprot:s961_g11.t1